MGPNIVDVLAREDSQRVHLIATVDYLREIEDIICRPWIFLEDFEDVAGIRQRIWKDPGYGKRVIQINGNMFDVLWEILHDDDTMTVTNLFDNVLDGPTIRDGASFTPDDDSPSAAAVRRNSPPRSKLKFQLQPFQQEKSLRRSGLVEIQADVDPHVADLWTAELRPI